MFTSNLQKYEEIYKSILCNIPLSANILGKLYNYDEILSLYKDKMLVLKNNIVNIDQLDISKLEFSDFNAYYGLNMAHYLFLKIYKDNKLCYMETLKNLLLKFINEINIEEKHIYSAYNRIYVLLEVLCFVNFDDVIKRKIREFIKENEIALLNSSKCGISTQILNMCAIALIGTYLNDQNILDDVNKKIVMFCHTFIDLNDYFFKNTSIENNKYYVGLLNNYIKIYDKNEYVNDLINKMINTSFLITPPTLALQSSEYPIDLSTYNKNVDIIEDKMYLLKNVGYFIYNNSNIYFRSSFFGKYGYKGRADLNSLVLCYKNRDIFINKLFINKNISSQEEFYSLLAFSTSSPKYYSQLPPNIIYNNIDENNSGIDICKMMNCICAKNILIFKNSSIRRNYYLFNKYILIKDIIKNDDYVSRFYLPEIINDLYIDYKNHKITFMTKGLGVSIRYSKTLKLSHKIVEENNIIYSYLEFTAQNNNCLPCFLVVFDESQCLDYDEKSSMFLNNKKLYKQIESQLNSSIISDIMSFLNIQARELYRYGKEAYINKNFSLSKKCEILNKIINNCSIKSSCDIGYGTRIAYGGIGILIHADSKIGKFCNLGTNITLGGGPKIGDFCYISTGVRIVKRLNIGDFVIIGANAVITSDIPSFSIVVGVPGRIIKKITPDNIDKYLLGYFASVGNNNNNFIEYAKKQFLRLYHNAT